jgi:hypothetical protein
MFCLLRTFYLEALIHYNCNDIYDSRVVFIFKLSIRKKNCTFCGSFVNAHKTECVQKTADTRNNVYNSHTDKDLQNEMTHLTALVSEDELQKTTKKVFAYCEA